MVTPAPGPRRFRKRPVEITAVQWTGNNLDEVRALVGVDQNGLTDLPRTVVDDGVVRLVLTTAQGQRVPADPGEWIVPEAQPGRAYPIAADVFAATYDDDITTSTVQPHWLSPTRRCDEHPDGSLTFLEPYGASEAFRLSPKDAAGFVDAARRGEFDHLINPDAVPERPRRPRFVEPDGTTHQINLEYLGYGERGDENWGVHWCPCCTGVDPANLPRGTVIVVSSLPERALLSMFPVMVEGPDGQRVTRIDTEGRRITTTATTATTATTGGGS